MTTADPSVEAFFPAEPSILGDAEYDTFSPRLNHYDRLATREVDWRYGHQPRMEGWYEETQARLDDLNLAVSPDSLVGDIRYPWSHTILYGDIEVQPIVDHLHGSTILDGKLTFTEEDRIGAYRIIYGYTTDTNRAVPIVVGPQIIGITHGSGDPSLEKALTIANTAVNSNQESRFSDVYPPAETLFSDSPEAATVVYRFPRGDRDDPVENAPARSTFTFQTERYSSEWYLHRKTTYAFESASLAQEVADAERQNFNEYLGIVLPNDVTVTITDNLVTVTGAFPPNRLEAVVNSQWK